MPPSLFQVYSVGAGELRARDKSDRSGDGKRYSRWYRVGGRGVGIDC